MTVSKIDTIIIKDKHFIIKKNENKVFYKRRNMGKDIEIPANIEEVNGKSEELKIEFDKGEISREEYETENRKLKNQKRWLELCLKKNRIKQEISICEKKKQEIDNSKTKLGSTTKITLIVFFCVICVLIPMVQIIRSYFKWEIDVQLYIVNTVVCVCLILWCIYLITRAQFVKIKIKRLKKALSNTFDLKNLIDVYAVNFYNECKYVLKTRTNISIDDIIRLKGRSYGKNDLSSAKEYYYKGESDAFIRVQIIKEKQKEEKRENLINKYNEEIKQQKIIRIFKGKNKYIARLIEVSKKAVNVIEAAKNLSKIAFNNALYTPQKKDWAIAGGIGSALGGAALGLASAANTQIENQKQQVIAEKKHETSKQQRELAYKSEGAGSEIKDCMSFLISDYKNVLVDEGNQIEKFNMFKFDEISITQVESENENIIRISVNYSLPETITLLSQKAILDGSLKLSVYNKLSDELVLSAFYIAPGYGQYNYKNAGFRNGSTISVDIPIFDNKVPDCNNLRCEITPDILWIIEENKEIFRKSNSDIDSKVKEYDKKLDDILRELCVSAYTG